MSSLLSFVSLSKLPFKFLLFVKVLLRTLFTGFLCFSHFAFQDLQGGLVCLSKFRGLISLSELLSVDQLLLNLVLGYLWLRLLESEAHVLLWEFGGLHLFQVLFEHSEVSQFILGIFKVILEFLS